MSKFSEWLFGKAPTQRESEYRIIRKELVNGHVYYLPQIHMWDRWEYFYNEGEIEQFIHLVFAEEFITKKIGNTLKSRQVVKEYVINDDGTYEEYEERAV